jgi:hypothetical protein
MFAGAQCMNFDYCGRSTFPRHINFQTTTRTQTSYGTASPFFGQRRQKSDFPLVTLHQHFRNGRGSAEITINLKNTSGADSVGVKQIRARALPDKPLE